MNENEEGANYNDPLMLLLKTINIQMYLIINMKPANQIIEVLTE